MSDKTIETQEVQDNLETLPEMETRHKQERDDLTNSNDKEQSEIDKELVELDKKHYQEILDFKKNNLGKSKQKTSAQPEKKSNTQNILIGLALIISFIALIIVLSGFNKSDDIQKIIDQKNAQLITQVENITSGAIESFDNIASTAVVTVITEGYKTADEVTKITSEETAKVLQDNANTLASVERSNKTKDKVIKELQGKTKTLEEQVGDFVTNDALTEKFKYRDLIIAGQISAATDPLSEKVSALEDYNTNTVTPSLNKLNKQVKHFVTNEQLNKALAKLKTSTGTDLTNAIADVKKLQAEDNAKQELANEKFLEEHKLLQTQYAEHLINQGKTIDEILKLTNAECSDIRRSKGYSKSECQKTIENLKTLYPEEKISVVKTITGIKNDIIKNTPTEKK